MKRPRRAPAAVGAASTRHPGPTLPAPGSSGAQTHPDLRTAAREDRVSFGGVHCRSWVGNRSGAREAADEGFLAVVAVDAARLLVELDNDTNTLSTLKSSQCGKACARLYDFVLAVKDADEPAGAPHPVDTDAVASQPRFESSSHSTTRSSSFRDARRAGLCKVRVGLEGDRSQKGKAKGSRGRVTGCCVNGLRKHDDLARGAQGEAGDEDGDAADEAGAQSRHARRRFGSRASRLNVLPKRLRAVSTHVNRFKRQRSLEAATLQGEKAEGAYRGVLIMTSDEQRCQLLAAMIAGRCVAHSLRYRTRLTQRSNAEWKVSWCADLRRRPQMAHGRWAQSGQMRTAPSRARR